MNRFETHRLVVRDLVREDLVPLRNILRRKENKSFIANDNFNLSTQELTDKYLKYNHLTSDGLGIYVVQKKEDGQIIGEAGLFRKPNSFGVIELVYFIDSKHWHKGYRTEVFRGLIDYCFHNLNIETIVTKMYSENDSSLKLTENYGMTRRMTGINQNGDKFYEFELNNPVFAIPG